MAEPRKMRKQWCRITSREEIRAILDSCERCRLAFSDDGASYVVPMNYGYTYIDDVLTLFFHSSVQGRKIDIIHKNKADDPGQHDAEVSPV